MTALERILCVDDDNDIRMIARMALEAVGGFTVEDCSSGAAALDAAPGFGPDLILLDVMMPGMDGPSTLKALRGIPGLGSIPVVFMTAKAMRAEVELYPKLGAAAVISKPFDPMTLSDQLRAIWKDYNG